MTMAGQERRDERAFARSSGLTPPAEIRRSSGRRSILTDHNEHASLPRPRRRRALKGIGLPAVLLLAGQEKSTRSSRQIN